ncbi:NAD(P)-binding domain-containing protein [Actinocrispum sp. NPDC049592]|uniref:NAD(P)-dependent oxidoreductase n=1 Tax=Actinocrispum sp. NPDC049592 TaxID=3154835 RepID=UPI003440DFDC
MRRDVHPGQVQEKKFSATVLGLGSMGSALAASLVAGGHQVTVWNRSPGKTEALADKGAAVATSAVEAVAANRLVVVCLRHHQSVVDVLDGTELTGRIVVNLTNSTPAQGRALAKWLAERDADLLEGGIMAIPPMIGSPSAFILYSGSRSAFDTYRPVLDVFGESHYLGTDPGLAALYDVSLLCGMYGMFMGIVQAFALITSEGLSASGFAPMLTRWLTAMMDAVAGTSEALERGQGVASPSPVEMQAAAYSNLLDTSTGQGVSPELFVALQGLLDEQVADGHGAEGIEGLVRILRKGER